MKGKYIIAVTLISLSVLCFTACNKVMKNTDPVQSSGYAKNDITANTYFPYSKLKDLTVDKEADNTDYYRISSGLNDYLFFTYDAEGNVKEYGLQRDFKKTENSQ